MTEGYGIPSNNYLPKSVKDKEYNFLPVRVLKVIMSEEDEPYWSKWGGWDSLGLIYFKSIYENVRTSDILLDTNVARPLNPNVKQYPLEQEIVYIMSLPNPDVAAGDAFGSSYYYSTSINIWNHPHLNALPISTKDTPQDYQSVSQGLSKKSGENDEEIKFGQTFVEKSNIKTLLPFEGDIIHEGRFGQSIRFGSTVPKKSNKNPWSSKGKDGDPIIIIRNGQPMSEKEGWVPTVENINGDGTSIYMCQGQAIPIIVASNNLSSFNSFVEKITPPVITFKSDPDPSVAVPSSIFAPSVQDSATPMVDKTNEIETQPPVEVVKDPVFSEEKKYYNISENGLKKLIRHEGVRYVVYDDRTGKKIKTYSSALGFPTIGVGHLIAKSEYSSFEKYLDGKGKMTKDEVNTLLFNDLQPRVKKLNELVKVNISQNMFDALLSMGFNTGFGNRSFLKAISATNNKEFREAAQIIKQGPKTSKGIVLVALERRRTDEATQYLEA